MNRKNKSIWIVVILSLIIMIAAGLSFLFRKQSQIVSSQINIQALDRENARPRSKSATLSSNNSDELSKLKAERERLQRAWREIQKIKNSPTVTPRRK